MTTLRYGLSVKNFTCPNCGEFSDEISEVSDSILDDTISALCCDSEFWNYDLRELGFDVIETIYGGEPAVWQKSQKYFPDTPEIRGKMSVV